MVNGNLSKMCSCSISLSSPNNSLVKRCHSKVEFNKTNIDRTIKLKPSFSLSVTCKKETLVLVAEYTQQNVSRQVMTMKTTSCFLLFSGTILLVCLSPFFNEPQLIDSFLIKKNNRKNGGKKSTCITPIQTILRGGRSAFFRLVRAYRPVSYTHLDVYKRQTENCIFNSSD